jgi:hypothetical protein
MGTGERIAMGWEDGKGGKDIRFAADDASGRWSVAFR